MKISDIQIGHVYAAKVSGKICRVRVHGANLYGQGWRGVNLETQREITIRGSKRLRYEVKPEGEKS